MDGIIIKTLTFKKKKSRENIIYSMVIIFFPTFISFYFKCTIRLHNKVKWLAYFANTEGVFFSFEGK